MQSARAEYLEKRIQDAKARKAALEEEERLKKEREDADELEAATDPVTGAVDEAKLKELKEARKVRNSQIVVIKPSEEQQKMEMLTDEVHKKAMFYLKCVLFPLALTWGIWNLSTEEYKSWSSWAISSMADFAYTFQFLEMWPQVFVNYKLKSVAHMPWRVLMYKIFSTFIDDIFAFWVMRDQMTQKHRWMSLRDDVIFFVWLFQWWCYRSDHKRADEYGYVYADPRAGDRKNEPQPGEKGFDEATDKAKKKDDGDISKQAAADDDTDMEAEPAETSARQRKKPADAASESPPSTE